MYVSYNITAFSSNHPKDGREASVCNHTLCSLVFIHLGDSTTRDSREILILALKCEFTNNNKRGSDEKILRPKISTQSKQYRTIRYCVMLKCVVDVPHYSSINPSQLSQLI